jgi:hypothetical protein
VAVEVLELDGRVSRRSRASLALAAVLVLAAVLGGFVVVQRSRAELFTPQEVRQALAASVANRLAPFPLAAPDPAEGTQPVVTPDQCRSLLLRPWLADAWPTGALSGTQTGAPGVDSYPSSEVFAFTTRRAADAERLFADARSALESHACDGATVQPTGPAGGAFTVTVEPQPRQAAPGDSCAVLSYVTTASSPQPGRPESVTTELLQYANTISLLVQLSEQDVVIFAGSYLGKDGERPTLTALCGELQRIRASR